MAEPKENVLMEKITSLCKRRGFIFQSSEIYGGIQGFWDYGPLGAELKRNVKELWWSTMTRMRDDVVGLEATIIMHPAIWRASGHVDTFSDPMCDCLLTKKRFRADQVEPQSGRAFYYVGACEAAALSEFLAKLDGGHTSEQHKSDFTVLSQAFSYQNRGTSRWIAHDRQFSPTESASVAFENAAARIGFVQNSKNVLAQVSSSKTLGKMSLDDYAVLLQKGKPTESALASARLFYQGRGITDPVVFFLSVEQLDATMRFNPENGALLTEPVPFNLMFKTYVGPTATEADVAYLRPETAQAIFAQFKNVHETSRQKVPFGVAQMGKAFRNEVTPRNYTFRSREFEQMELEFFIKPDEAVEAVTGAVATPASKGHPGEPQPNWGWQLWHQYWVEERIKFYEGIGLPRTTLEEYWQKPEELAHYARACVDILFKFPFGTQELEGIAARSDYDLSQHERCSGKSMGIFDEELRTAFGKLPPEKQTELKDRYYQARLKYLTKSGVPVAEAGAAAQEDADGLAKGQYIPHVIEPSAGVDRLILALLANAFSEVTETDAKGKSETRVVLKFHPRVAPIKVAVLPLLKNKPELAAKARAIFESLRGHMMAFHDEAGSIGRRYARQDEAGTPFCVTVDFETFEGIKDGPQAGVKDTVTIRHRDDGKQERIAAGELLPWLLARVR
ncbi:MAG: glycine--tRNA ligase [Limisphaerales bacterium]